MTTDVGNVKSDSDDGGDLVEGDTYLPIDTDGTAGDPYNPEFMEEDGNYNLLLGGITVDFQDLNEDLTPPSNLYNR